MDLNQTLDQMDLTDIHGTFIPKVEKHTFSSEAHDTFSNIDHMVEHSLSKFKKTESIPSIISFLTTMVWN